MLFSIFGLFNIIIYQNLTCSFFWKRIILLLIVLLSLPLNLVQIGSWWITKVIDMLNIIWICAFWDMWRMVEFYEFYGLEGDHFVFFHYVGNNFFNITLFKGNRALYLIQFYDSIQNRCPIIHGPYVHFTIKLSKYLCHSSHLVIF